MIMVQSGQSVCYLNKLFNSNSYSMFDLTITKQAKCSQNHLSIQNENSLCLREVFYSSYSISYFIKQDI